MARVAVCRVLSPGFSMCAAAGAAKPSSVAAVSAATAGTRHRRPRRAGRGPPVVQRLPSQTHGVMTPPSRQDPAHSNSRHVHHPIMRSPRYRGHLSRGIGCFPMRGEDRSRGKHELGGRSGAPPCQMITSGNEYARPLPHLAELPPGPGCPAPSCPRVQRDDRVVEPLQPGLPLPHDLRLEGAVAVPRHRQVHRPDIGQHRLAAAAVPAVPGPRPAWSCLS